MAQKLVEANGVRLCVETFGNPADPPVLLIMGAMASMVSWPDSFCRALADGGRYVMRYDNRDVGRSVTYEPGSPPYGLEDLTEDAAHLLEVLALPAAHVVGISMGGVIGQLLAIRHPERVRTLTLIASTPSASNAPDLPGMEERVLAHFASGASVDRTDEASVVEFLAAGMRVLGGRGRHLDEAYAREMARREFRHADRYESCVNHAVLRVEPWRDRLGEIHAPTLVIHGTDDPILPLDHGRALAREIPGARLVVLEGAGHELHPDDLPRLAAELLAHTA
jgi:pimeloyl-ACP methyl ester carboxylesterase